LHKNIEIFGNFVFGKIEKVKKCSEINGFGLFKISQKFCFWEKSVFLGEKNRFWEHFWEKFG